MRKMLLSFSADVFERIQTGDKIYEHRRTFPNEPIEAYLYVSRPVQSITGKLILKNRVEIVDWKEKFFDDKDAIKRIDEYLKHYRYAMEISEYRETNSIHLSQLRRELEKFIVPQMYYYLDNTELLSYLDKCFFETGKVIKHDFSNITSNLICTY